MSAAEKIRELPLTPRDLALQILAEVADRGGDSDEAATAFAKSMEGRRATLRPAEHLEYFELVCDGKTPKARKELKPIPTDLEKEAQKLERQARRIRLAGQVDAAAEKKVRMKYIMPNDLPLGKCTLDYVARVGGAFVKLGKRGSKELIEHAYTERDLEKAKIG